MDTTDQIAQINNNINYQLSIVIPNVSTLYIFGINYNTTKYFARDISNMAKANTSEYVATSLRNIHSIIKAQYNDKSSSMAYDNMYVSAITWINNMIVSHIKTIIVNINQINMLLRNGIIVSNVPILMA